MVAGRMSLEASVRVSVGDLAINVELEIATGELVVLLGPNGAGKTSLLRALAGLLPLEDGSVALDGEVLEAPGAGVRVPPERRPIGFVFQDYLLFPHMTVLENVAFGLRARGASRTDGRRVGAAWLERMDLARFASARPGALSGGQAQKVALARALVMRPRLLLLDEPLAALDAGTRLEMRRELVRELKEFEGTRLLVTHDPLEAMTLGDRLVVLEEGRVVQSGTPRELRERPRSDYVAGLVGLNLFRGSAAGGTVILNGGAELVAPGTGTGDVYAAVHPRAVALYKSKPEGSPRNVWQGTIAGLDLEGDRARVTVSGPVRVVAEVTRDAASDLRLTQGQLVWASIKATEIEVYPA
jgi:molybdate transport system ATP-binding protein